MARWKGDSRGPVGFTVAREDGSAHANRSMRYTTFTKRKEKTDTIISAEAEKTWQTSTSIQDKNAHQVGTEGACRDTINTKYEKPPANAILSGDKLTAFCLGSRTRQGCLLSPLLPDVVLELLAAPVRQEKDINAPKAERKKENHLCLQDMWSYR